MEVLTSAYEMSHGRRPRGAGTWVFVTEDQWRRDDYLDRPLFTYSGLYTAAKKAAVAHFSAAGARPRRLVVAP